MHRTAHLTRLALPALALLGACTSARPAADPLSIPDRFTVYYLKESVATRRELPIDAARVWAALPDAFRDLGFAAAPAAPTHAGDRVLITPRMRVRGAALYPGERTSDYLDCGLTSTYQARADVYEVTFAIITRVAVVSAEVTRLETIVDGNARDPTLSGRRIACQSTGRMEEQLFQYVVQRTR